MPELCEDCKTALTPKRAEMAVVCGKCFGIRADKWAKGELKGSDGQTVLGIQDV